MSDITAASASKQRNVVLCFDGTGNVYGTANTNVVKLFGMLALGNNDQLTWYDPGVGTFSIRGAWTRASKWVTRVMGLAFGLGLAEKLEEAYRFLQRTVEDGDRIFLFGFSRGAYTARALAGLLHKCGLLRPELDSLVPYAIDIYRKEFRKSVVTGFKATFARECPVHFLGLWDTVSTIGWVWDPKVLPFTRTNPSVRTVRHAIAIDERRAFFRTNRWGDPSQGQDVQEVWFAGVHSDVGGSYPENESGLSQVALQWLIEEAGSQGLILDPIAARKTLPREAQPGNAPSVPDAQGPIHESLRHLWWIAEIFPKWMRDPKNAFRSRPRFNLGRHRFMPDDAVLHASVYERLRSFNYRPSNLPPNLLSPELAASDQPRGF